MLRYRHAFIFPVLILVAASSNAVTYIVPSDRDMVRRSAGIVMATAIASHVEMSDNGIVTITELKIVESLKGSFARGEQIRLVEPGGVLGHMVTAIPGVPRYEDGKTYLVFLRQNDGRWGTWSLGLGQFTFTTDLTGREYLTRPGDEGIFGWNEADGKQHVEKLRSAPEFLNFVRGVVRNEINPLRSDYLIDPSQLRYAPFAEYRPRGLATIVTNARADYMMSPFCRWNNGATATFAYCCGATPQPGYDGPAALSAAVANWNGVNNLTHYTAGSRDDTANAGLKGAGSGHPDGKNAVLFNDPNNDLAAFGSGVAGLGGTSEGTCCYTFAGDATNYCTPTEVDIVMAKSSNLTISQTYFIGILTHELGHTLGFRHSNQRDDNATPCTSAPIPCTTDAIMNATVPFNLATLRPYDQDAVNNVYGAGSVCSGPSNVVATANPTTVNAGGTTNLSVTHGGSTAATYQWFTGNPGSGAAIAGATSSTLQRSVSTNTTFYVAVTACTPPVTVNSNAVTVNVTQCTPVSVVNITASAPTITVGNSVTLNATTTGGSAPITITWTANGVSIGSGPSVTHSPQITTTYQATATASGCSSGIGSNTVTVTVVPVGACTTTMNSVTATPSSPFPGDTFTLSATATTTQSNPTITYQWFRGSLNDTSNPIGTGSSLQVSQTETTTYWVRATSNCTANPTAQQQITVTRNTGACGTNANQLCINNARYRITLTATDPAGRTGQGVAFYQSNVFGYFTLPDFSAADDPQIFVKVLELVPGTPWVFYAGLTNLDYTFTVFDTQTGQTFNTYRVPPPASLGLSPFQNVGDFDVFGSKSPLCSNVTVTKSNVAATPGTCATTSTALCLLNRFTITLQATDNPTRTTNSGPGIALPAPGTNKFGFFTVPALASPSDVQAFVKMLDATSFGAGHWVFLGGLTDMRLEMTVTDTQTGRRNVYRKPEVSTCGYNDTAAFPQ